MSLDIAEGRAMPITPRDILDFWFAQGNEKHWFKRSDAFDEAVKSVLGPHIEPAAAGAYDAFLETPEGTLALVLLLDQAPRNVYRGEARSHDHDARVREIAHGAIEKGFDQAIASQNERRVFYLPLEHSEDLADQEHCCELMAALDENPEWHKWAEMHRVIIARFGRFPHRNTLLGRVSTPEEIEFLKEPNSSF